MGTDEKSSGPRMAVPPPPPVSSLEDLVAQEVDEAWDAPALAVTPVEALSSQNLVDDPEDERPHDRATVPTQLRPVYYEEELSASDLEDEEEAQSERRALATTRPPPASHRPSLQDLAFALENVHHPLTLPVMQEQTAPMSVPPVSLDVRAPLTSLPGETAQSVPVPRVTRRNALLFVASHLAVAAGVLGFVWMTRPEPRPVAREPRLVMEDRVGIGAPASGGSVDYAVPSEGCKIQDLARVIAPRALPGPGLDASVLESGFGVGLVSKPNEATGIRLEATTLRTAETLRVQSVWPVARVAIEGPGGLPPPAGGADEDERFQVRLDGQDSRSVSANTRITALKGGVFINDDAGTRLLWGLPGAHPKTTETVRAITRPEGGNVVAVRRNGMFWIGVTGHGPMASLVRANTTLGAPALAAAPAGGGVIVWAERPLNARGPFTIMTSAVSVDGDRTTASSPVEVAEGISPALANLPSGEVLLVYSDGGAGAHRIVAQRLGGDLSPIGAVMVLSEPGTNAGSPAVAVDPDGRTLVAYLAIEKGRAEVRATALLCH